jgi:hypothetical protein
VDINGDEAACFVFDSHSQLEAIRFDFALPSGSHVLRVSTSSAELVEAIEVNAELWGIVDVAADPEDQSTNLGLIVQDEPTVYDAEP